MIRAVFSVNTGRSGSHYLASLFGAVRDAAAEHEDQPLGIGPPMIAWNQGDEGPMRAVAARKAAVIRAKTRDGQLAFLEANHAFVKGYGWLLPDAHLPQEAMGVIVLRRDPQAIAESLVRTRTVPGRTRWARTWYLSPGQARNLAEPAPGASDLELARWYVDEIERRGAAFRERFPRITYAEVELEDLNDRGYVTELLEGRFGLSVDREELARRIGARVDDIHRHFAPVPDLSDLPGLTDPDALPRPAQVELLERILAEARPAREEALAERVHLAGPLWSALPGVVSWVTRRERELAERLGVALPQTDLEAELFVFLLQRLRPLDPLGLTYVIAPDGEIQLPAANAGPGSLLATLLTGALRLSLGCRLWLLALVALALGGAWRLLGG